MNNKFENNRVDDVHTSYEEKMKTYIDEKKIECEYLIFEASCHSVADAALAANANISEFVKNICFIGNDKQLIVAIVKGENRASSKKVAKLLNIDSLRTATSDEMLAYTGYPCGGTPSFGFDAKFIIDPKVLEQKYIYTGGGSERSLVKISPESLKQANFALIAKVRK